MPDVAVTIAGRVYRIACDEGEDERLTEVASLLDRKIETMRQEFGELGDQRLIVMAAISFVDLLVDAHGRVTALEAEIAGLKERLAEAYRREEEMTGRLETSLAEAAERIERIAGELAGPRGD
jgi:cell division protein ZapA